MRVKKSQAEPPQIWPIRLTRIILICVGLAAWFGTQTLLAKRNFPSQGIGDGLFALTAGMNAFLQTHPAWANGLLAVSSAVVDALGILLFLGAIFGPSLRPFLGLLILFGLRQICQGLTSLPEPSGMIWHDPGFPSLLVTYNTSTDLFFSAHTAIAVFGATELARFRRRWLMFLGIAVSIFEAATVIVLRAHYTMDVFTGIITALWVAGIVDSVAAPLDRILARRMQPRAAS